MKELNLSTKNVKRLGMLLVLFLGVVAITAIGKADGKKAGQTAEESVTALFSIDFKRDIAAQLPPCTESGKAFWTMTLTQVADLARTHDAEIQGVRADVNGKPEPYSGIGGEGQIMPVTLAIITRDRDGQTQTEVSEIRVLMIKGEDGQWLLDSLAPELPGQSLKLGGK